MSQFHLTPDALPDWSAVLPLDLVRAHLRVDGLDEDGLIGMYRDGALDLVQSYTMKSLVGTAFTWRGQFPGGRGAVTLGVAPVTSITSIAWTDSAGAAQTASAAMVLPGVHGRLNLAPGESWPRDVAEGDAPVTIKFSAGYPANQIPRPLLQAALLMVGQMYRNRESVITGTIATELPLGFTRLCDAYRSPVI